MADDSVDGGDSQQLVSAERTCSTVLGLNLWQLLLN